MQTKGRAGKQVQGRLSDFSEGGGKKWEGKEERRGKEESEGEMAQQMKDKRENKQIDR